MEFLDKSGVTYLWKKIRAAIEESADKNANLYCYLKNLTFDGTNYTRIDFSPFAKNAPDFRMVMQINFNPDNNADTELATLFSCYHEAKGAYDGFAIRRSYSKDANSHYIIEVAFGETVNYIPFEYDNGEQYYPCLMTWTKINDVSTVTWSSGYAERGGFTFRHSETFDNGIYLGAAYNNDDNSMFRYAIGDIDYIKIEAI